MDFDSYVPHNSWILSFHVFFSEIKLREHGSEIIEVSDNGIGVEEENFQGLSELVFTLS